MDLGHYICNANKPIGELKMKTLMFNNMPDREQVQVLHISSLLGCSQYCQATYLKSSKNYANIQEESKQTAGGQELKNPTNNQVQPLEWNHGSRYQIKWAMARQIGVFSPKAGNGHDNG